MGYDPFAAAHRQALDEIRTEGENRWIDRARKAEAQVAAVLELHPLGKNRTLDGRYDDMEWCETCEEPYPCATRVAAGG